MNNKVDKDKEERIKQIMRMTGYSRDDAEFVYAIESGEIDGDEGVFDDDSE